MSEKAAGVSNPAKIAGVSNPIEAGSVYFWTPAEATTVGSVLPAHWYKADAGTYQEAAGAAAINDNDPVGQWQDQAAAGDNVEGSLKPSLKLDVLNGRAVLRFNNDRLVGSFTEALTQPITVFVVAKLKAEYVGNGNDMVIFDDSATLNGLLILQQNNVTPNIWQLYCGTHVYDSIVTDDDYNIFCAIANGASSYLYKNGVLAMRGDVGSNGMAGLTVGANQKGISNWEGDIAEILIYDSALSDGDREQVNRYLAAYYGMGVGRLTDKICVFTDLHISSQCSAGGAYGKYCLRAASKAQRIVDICNAENVTDIVCLGDYLDIGCSGTCSETKEQADATIASVTSVIETQGNFYFVPGNHDPKTFSKAEIASYISEFSSPYYWYKDFKNFRLIGLDAQLDSNGDLSTKDIGYIPEAEKEWLKNTALNTANRCIVLCHQRLDGSGSNWYDVGNAAEVRQIIENANVKLVLTGHYHDNAVTEINGITYVTLRAACHEDNDDKAAHALLYAYDTGTIRIVGRDGQNSYLLE